MLAVTGASIQDGQGLNGINRRLLRQRGAIGEPESQFRASGKKVSTMVAVVNELKQPSDEMTPSTLSDVDPPET